MEKLKAFLDLLVKYPFFVIGAVLVVLGAVGVIPLGVTSGSPSLSIATAWRIFLAIVGVLAIAFDAARLWREPTTPSLAKATGGIAQPSANSTVTRQIAAHGWSRDIENGLRLWLIVEVGNQKWPKGNELQLAADGTWRSDVYEDGTGDRFSLSLFVTDADGHSKIRAWLEIGALIGYHPFEVDIPGTRRLARVDGLQK